MTQCYSTCSIERNIFPYTCVTVTDTVHKGKVPTYCHQHGSIQTNIAISTIMELTSCPPRFRLRTSGDIYRINFNSQSIAFPNFHKIRNINIILNEHAVYRAQQVTIHPYFCPVVDTIQLQPDSFPLE